jgi:hypothetical protein
MDIPHVGNPCERCGMINVSDERRETISALTPYYSENGITIYHGDCREVAPALGRVELLCTDPPYGVAFKSGWNGRHGDCAVRHDQTTELRDWMLENIEYHGAFVFGSVRSLRPYTVAAVLIWDKGEHVGMGDLGLPWKPNFEEIYVMGEGFYAARRGSSVIKFNAIAGCVGLVTSRLHPVEKPVELMRYLISRHVGQTVLDPFMGSGTTLRAAKDLGRKAIGIEIEERYCEIAANRLRQEVLSFDPEASPEMSLAI